MHKRHSSSLPKLWMMTDERMGDDVIARVRRLPRGAGVVFRHYSLDAAKRRALLKQARRVAQARRLVLTVGGESHGRRKGAITAPVHSVRERIAAERAGAKLLFISPVFATASHPGARTLGRVRFGLTVLGAKCPVIALGGINPRRARTLAAFKIHGWAGIDAFEQRQKRNDVPR